MIRQFKLRNEYAREYSLNVSDTAFLHEPQGLGYEMDYGYMRLGYSFVRNFIKDKQMEISGTVIFTAASPYEAAADFLKFIRGSAKLTLVYTTDAGEFLRDVDLVSYEKTEIGEGGVQIFLSERLSASVPLCAEDEEKIEGEKKHVAERVYGRFLRRLSLPGDADADNIRASFKDGVLTVEIPRKAPVKPQARSIEIAKG